MKPKVIAHDLLDLPRSPQQISMIGQRYYTNTDTHLPNPGRRRTRRLLHPRADQPLGLLPHPGLALMVHLS
jgi:hypothetical protein